MDTTTKLLRETLEIMLDEQRWDINAAYGRRDAYLSKDTEYQHYQREIDRRLSTIKKIEILLLEIKSNGN